MKKLVFSILVLSFATTSSAHTAMEQSSILHSAIHIITSVGLYLAMMGAGFYVLNKLPKAKRQRIKTDIK